MFEFNFLSCLRIAGLFIAAGIGVFRLVKNHMDSLERTIYGLVVFSMLWFGFVYLFSEIGPLTSIETHAIRNDLIRSGWPPLIVSQILIMLYYRRFTRRL